MTVAEVQYGGSGGTVYVRLNGTIAEVLQDLGNKGINASRVIYYTDDATNAVAVYCRQA